MRLPCTSTSPVNGASPPPSKMRTLVNMHVGHRQFSLATLVSAAREKVAQLALRTPRAARSASSGRSAAARRRACSSRACSLSAIARTSCGGATPSSSPVTSSTGASMRSTAAGLRLGQRLAAARVALGVLAHQALAHERDGERRALARVGRDRGVEQAERDLVHAGRAFAARLGGARADRRPRRLGRRDQRTEQREAARRASARVTATCWQTIVPIEWPIQCARVDVQPRADREQRLDEALDRERPFDALRARRCPAGRRGSRGGAPAPASAACRCWSCRPGRARRRRRRLRLLPRRRCDRRRAASWRSARTGSRSRRCRRSRCAPRRPAPSQRGGLKPMPTPAGVPVAITSPG